MRLLRQAGAADDHGRVVGRHEHRAVGGKGGGRRHRRIAGHQVALAREGLHVRVVEGDVQRNAFVDGAHLDVQGGIVGAQPVDQLTDRIQDLLVVLADDRAGVDGDTAGVGHDVGLHTALDGGDVHRKVAQQRVGFIGDVLGLQRLQQPAHVGDGVDAEMRHGAVRRLPLGLQLDPQHAFLGGDDAVGGRLADNHEADVIQFLLPHQFPSPHGLDFLARRAGKEQIALEGRAALLYRPHRHEHGGNASLHVGGAQSPDLAVVDVGRQHLMLPVVARRHRVQMAAEQHRPPLALAVQAADHAGSAVFGVRHQLGSHVVLPHPVGHERRRLGFIARRVDRSDTHQVLGQLHQHVLVQGRQRAFLRVHRCPFLMMKV